MARWRRWRRWQRWRRWGDGGDGGDGVLDIVYYDPPYNKHPYNIYYFLLDIVNNMDLDIEVPDTYRGQPKGWKKS